MNGHFSKLRSRRCTKNFVLGSLLLLVLVTTTVSSYNLEDRLPLFKYGPSGSKFGFSVAQHRTSTDDMSGLTNTLLVVGAPTASGLASQSSPKEPKNPGGVFYCPVSTDPLDCKRIEMDVGGDTTTGAIISIKSNQWLGVSVKSQGPGKFLVTCGHRFTQHLTTGYNVKTREVERVCGKCFLLNATSPNEINEVDPDSELLDHEFISSPCDLWKEKPVNLRTYVLYGVMQAGVSISLHNEQYLLGAPGAWYWTGAMFDFDMPNSGNDAVSPMTQTPTCYRGERTGVKCHDIPLRRDAYMGFSVASSDSVGTDSDEVFYAAGAPRGNISGAVIFFKKVLADSGDKYNLVADYINTVVRGKKEIGSSFGFSIALTDINDDDMDDLIVGAPQYYEYNNQHKRGGAVYIYINRPDRGFRQVEPQVLYGPLDSYFGHSIAALGDIDQDGYNDFAVGAPYENENGTVHIYRGHPDGKVKESQKITASDYSFVKESNEDIIGFGASLSGEVDADSNKYPDLLIGTYSDHVALIRSRPIISANMTLEVETEELDLEIRTCDIGGARHTCFKLRFCFKYTARHNEYPANVPIKYKLTLDSIRQDEKKSSRVYFDSPKGPSTVEEKFTIPKSDRKVCPGDTHNIFFRGEAKDKLSNIGIKLEFDLDFGKIKREKPGEEVLKMINDPILDVALPKKREKTVRIKTSCEADECQSNLLVTATMDKEILVGDVATVPLKLAVSNDGEEAHQAFITISLPPQIDFIDFDVRKPATDGIHCSSAASGEASFIKCDLGNPYKSKQKDDIELTLGVSRLTPQDKNIEFQIKGHTTSKNPKLPSIALQSQVVIELALSLAVFAQPEQVRYSEVTVLGETGMKNTQDIGPLIIYTFNVKNEGRTYASGVKLNVELPREISNGKWLLYLVSAGVSDGGAAAGHCSDTYINELQLEPSIIEEAASSGRRRRAAKGLPDVIEAEAQASTSGGGFVSKVTLSCDKKNTQCVNVQCDLDSLAPQAITTVVFQMHVWEPTFLEEFKQVDLVYIRTSINVSSNEDNVRIKGDKTSGVVQTTVDHDVFKSDISSAFPWWYILVGVLILLILYVVIIVLLIKCGFFRRKKFPRQENDEDEDKLVDEKRDESRM